ncbi:MAG: N-acetyl-gamma-glutamyl-phosphate reductase [Asticcacaulis sp.]
MTHKVFIDGEAGTTGLQIASRLSGRADLELIRLGDAERKDRDARRRALNAADAVILCLPDEAAIEAVSLIENETTRVIDASTAHRVSEGWVYGFAEMEPGQREAIATSRLIANPGCYATGFIALVRPLTRAGLIPDYWPLTCNAVSGYSGGGKAMIASFEDPQSPDATADNYRIYATGLNHKHLPEMMAWGGLESPPLFTPAVGRYAQGMIVEIPLQLWALPTEPSLADLLAVFEEAYAGPGFVHVASAEEAASTKALQPEMLNNTNALKIYVFGDPHHGQARLVAVLDNLGKGASGAAVQNLNIALGVPENLGLS